MDLRPAFLPPLVHGAEPGRVVLAGGRPVDHFARRLKRQDLPRGDWGETSTTPPIRSAASVKSLSESPHIVPGSTGRQRKQRPSVPPVLTDSRPAVKKRRALDKPAVASVARRRLATRSRCDARCADRIIVRAQGNHADDPIAAVARCRRHALLSGIVRDIGAVLPQCSGTDLSVRAFSGCRRASVCRRSAVAGRAHRSFQTARRLWEYAAGRRLALGKQPGVRCDCLPRRR